MKVERKEFHKVNDLITWPDTKSIRKAKATVHNGKLKTLSFKVKAEGWETWNFKGIDEINDLFLIFSELLKFTGNPQTDNASGSNAIKSRSRQLRIAIPEEEK